MTKPENPSEAKVHAPTLASDAPASGSDPMLERGDTLPAPAGTSAALSELVIVEPTFYADRKILTHGGMGRIVTARDLRLRRTVAIKELRADSPEARGRFEREALLTARLQHPSIVSIHEAGRWPSGEPFYAMKLVPGRSLDKVIGEARTLDERLALLPHVIAVADALAYAHKERVIHRDLKPQNVMIGEFGETVVIDWGLAKDLDDAGRALDRGTTPDRGGNAVVDTEVGEVMGTPAYMPPEQAEGVPVDERADVYAIGAVLYHLLAGAPPYTGGSGLEVLVALKEDPPMPLVERQAGIPADLLAVVDRAMARDLAARYPTARELAQDLRRFQSGQLVAAHQYSVRQLVRRWLRRHRTAVAVAAVATLVVATVGIASIRRIVREQQRADAERTLAEEHRAEAEDLMGFMLGDLKDKLEPIGKLDLLDSVANKANDYYVRHADARSPDERGRRARALANLADVRRDQGDLARAGTAYWAALTIREQLAAQDPSNASWQRDVASSQDSIGDLQKRQGDLVGALAAYRAALTIREQLAAQDPSNAILQRAISVSHNKVGDVLILQGDLAAAQAAYRADLAIAETLAAQDQNNVTWQRDLSVSHNKIGDVLALRGEMAEALTAYRAALAIRDKLAAQDPNNASLQRDLSVSHNNVGKVLERQADPAAALAAYRTALATREKLAAQDPSNASWQHDLAVSHNNVGDVLARQGDTAGALTMYRAALVIAERLAAEDTSNAVWQRDLSVSHDRIGDAQAQRGDLAAALAAYRVSLAILERVAAQDPSNATWQRDVAGSHANIGTALTRQGDLVGALAAYRAALTIRQQLAAQDPSNATWQRDLAETRDAIETCCPPTRSRDVPQPPSASPTRAP